MISLFPRHSVQAQLKACCLLPRKCRSYDADIYIHMCVYVCIYVMCSIVVTRYL